MRKVITHYAKADQTAAKEEEKYKHVLTASCTYEQNGKEIFIHPVN